MAIAQRHVAPRSTRIMSSLAIGGVLGLFIIFTLFPAVWMVLTSLKTQLDAFEIPPKWIWTPTVEAYQDIFRRDPFARFFMNSLVIAVVTTVVSLGAGSLAAYALSVFRFPGRSVIGFLIIAIRMLPPVSTIVPMYLFFERVDLIDTRVALILVYTAFNVSFATWMLKGFIDGLPKDLIECALVDGANHFGAFWRIILPLVAPGLAATAVFTFVLSWNDFVFALVLTTTQAKTLPVLVTSYITEEGVRWNNVAAAGTIIVMPVVIFSLLAQKHLIRGMTAGAVKG